MIRSRKPVKTIGLLVFCLSLLAEPAFAGVEEWYLYPSLQYFSWSEYFGGRQLLQEEGPLFGLGGGAGFDLYRKSLMLRARGEMFGGDVHYRGQTQVNPNPALSQLPVKTSVIYFGTKLETDIGWRMRPADFSVEPFAGLGYRWWLRSLEDTTAVDGSGNQVQVGGYTEYWQTLYSRIGLRGSYDPAGDLSFFAEAGGKYPFLNRNSTEFPGAGTVTLKPEPRWSAFSEIGVSSGRLRAALFYEGFRFGQSPVVPVGGGIGLLQPKTDSDIFGVNVGWTFN